MQIHVDKRCLWWGLLSAVIASLLACGGASTSSARLEDYVSRLERALEVERPAAPTFRPPRLSEARLAKLPINTTAISVLDFLALSGCELQVNIGRRNSTLGRNASSSQALLLDVEFLHQVPHCVTRLKKQNNTTLATTLETMADERKAALPRRIFNALLAESEFGELWHLPPQLDDYPAHVNGDVIASLNYFDTVIRQWLQGNYSANFANHNALFEGHLAQLRAGDGGALLLASSTLYRYLAQASVLLRNRNTDKPLCPGGRVTRSAEIAQTVITKFFTTHTQPWLASVNARRHSLMAPLQSIEEQLAPVLPVTYKAWQAQRDATLNTTAEAPKSHIATVKAVFAACASTPWSR